MRVAFAAAAAIGATVLYVVAGLVAHGQTVFNTGTQTLPAGATINIGNVIGLANELTLRPVKGAAFTTGAVAFINSQGQIDAVVGASSDCVKVDGSSGPCGVGGGGSSIFIGTTAQVLLRACLTGDLAFANNATPGQNLYECTATNTWTQQLNSGANGASAALDNLGATSVNQSLIPNVNATRVLGSAAKHWGASFIDAITGTAALATALAVNGTNCGGGTSFALGVDASGNGECGAVQAMAASGVTHKAGLAPDPGSVTGTTKFLREDATYVVPPSGVAPFTVDPATGNASTPGTITGAALSSNGLGVSGLQLLSSVAFANLATFQFAFAPTTPGNGTLVYCFDCTTGSNPCTGSGTGAFAGKQNGAWKCF